MTDVTIVNHCNKSHLVVFSADTIKGMDFLTILNGYYGDQTAFVDRKSAFSDAQALAIDMGLTVTNEIK